MEKLTKSVTASKYKTISNVAKEILKINLIKSNDMNINFSKLKIIKRINTLTTAANEDPRAKP